MPAPDLRARRLGAGLRLREVDALHCHGMRQMLARLADAGEAERRLSAVRGPRSGAIRRPMGDDRYMVKLDGPFPFKGEVVWLTREQGGRKSGPPASPDNEDYAATAFVPPRNFENGLASFVLRGFSR